MGGHKRAGTPSGKAFRKYEGYQGYGFCRTGTGIFSGRPSEILKETGFDFYGTYPVQGHLLLRDRSWKIITSALSESVSVLS